MKSLNSKITNRIRRRNRIRSKVSGTETMPRLSVFKSNTSISAQIIDDTKSVTLVTAHSREVKGKSMMEKASLVGKLVAEKAKAKKISKVVFDRGGFIYVGNVKALADGAREGGLIF
ncbi:MAG: large subunit ribosomal protein L18 [Parcubacteria group bacterium Gr01-1014_46]|nr:MAG: large subunit ribosomal protein L18 [Parcubacteria group bacterium Gr01-1014_46]